MTQFLVNLFGWIVAHHRGNPYGSQGGATPLFEDTSTDQQQGMPGMPGGFGQFAGNEFLQGPMANVAVGYGAAVASQGKEYVEKHVCWRCPNSLLNGVLWFVFYCSIKYIHLK